MSIMHVRWGRQFLGFAASIACLVAAWPVHVTTAGTTVQSSVRHAPIGARNPAGRAGDASCAPWTRTDGPPGGVLRATAAIAATDVWAVGSLGNPSQTLAEHWDGRGWRAVAGPRTGKGSGLYGVAAVARDDVWAVGDAAGAMPLMEHWDGRTWHRVPGPFLPGPAHYYLQGIAALSSDNVWAVGAAHDGGHALIEHYDGQSWRIVPNPDAGAGSALHAVATVASDDVWAVGSTGGATRRTLMEHWDGARWKAVASPNVDADVNRLLGVTAIGPANVWAVGEDNQLGGAGALVEHWNGSFWRIVPGPDPVTASGSLIARRADLRGHNGGKRRR
jgi:hypothetical protein